VAIRSVSTHDPRKVTRMTIKVVALFSAVLSVVFLFSFVFSEEGISELQRSQKRVNELQREVQKLETENARLRTVLDDLNRSSYTVERIAREDLGMARAGETVYVLPEEPADAPARAKSTPGS